MIGRPRPGVNSAESLERSQVWPARAGSLAISVVCRSRLDSPGLSPYLSAMLRGSTNLPAFIAPQIPVLSTEPPTGQGWIHEIKHDGYRTLLRIDRGKGQAFTRNGHDWSDKYGLVIAACHKLRCRSALIDGEIIVQDAKGASDFGRDKLRQLILPDVRSALQFSDHFDGEGAKLFKQACMIGLEGIISKRTLSPYRSGPSKFWLKTKNVTESELILIGTDHDNEGKPIAYLARGQGRELQFAGTAFLTLAGEARRELQARMDRLSIDRAPIRLRQARKPLWLKPELFVRVRHLAGGDTLRHATVRGVAPGQ
jgi:bifunctional non-homologous end joining protein LigD